MQDLQTSITWKQCANLPTRLSEGVTTVINDKVYCGGVTDDDDDKYIVYCYDPSWDKWTTLPPLPVKFFSLGQIGGELVAVGGQKNIGKERTNQVHTYDEQSQKWKQTIPPIPTARSSPGVLSFQLALVVAGEYTPSHSYKTTVEIFKSDTS